MTNRSSSTEASAQLFCIAFLCGVLAVILNSTPGAILFGLLAGSILIAEAISSHE